MGRCSRCERRAAVGSATPIPPPLLVLSAFANTGRTHGIVWGKMERLGMFWRRPRASCGRWWVCAPRAVVAALRPHRTRCLPAPRSLPHYCSSGCCAHPSFAHLCQRWCATRFRSQAPAPLLAQQVSQRHRGVREHLAVRRQLAPLHHPARGAAENTSVSAARHPASCPARLHGAATSCLPHALFNRLDVHAGMACTGGQAWCHTAGGCVAVATHHPPRTLRRPRRCSRLKTWHPGRALTTHPAPLHHPTHTRRSPAPCRPPRCARPGPRGAMGCWGGIARLVALAFPGSATPTVV